MHRLIYKSRASGEIDKETFRDILYTSIELNRSNGLNGVLFATKSRYLQFLEGEYEKINTTFSKIKKDSRHTDIDLITFGAVEKGIFDNWSMRGFGIFDLNLELEAKLKKKYGEEDGDIRIPGDAESALSLARDVSTLRED